MSKVESEQRLNTRYEMCPNVLHNKSEGHNSYGNHLSDRQLWLVNTQPKLSKPFNIHGVRPVYMRAYLTFGDLDLHARTSLQEIEPLAATGLT